ncbi:hypothetical protein EV128_125160 [Rhizobium azibense]|nr:hypothetical protein EV128_125160 [Rhizobium azibense]
MAGLRFHLLLESRNTPLIRGGWFDAPSPTPTVYAEHDAIEALEKYLSEQFAARVIVMSTEARTDISTIHVQFN